MSKNPTLYILTPCYGGVVTTNYMICLIKTIQHLNALHIPCIIEFCQNDSLITRARNNLIARAMSNPEMTHCLFIDSDIVWEPNDVVILLRHNKDLIGGLYPKKNYVWNKLTKDYEMKHTIRSMIQRKQDSCLQEHISDEDMIKANLLEYNVNLLNTVIPVENNLAKVRHIATGFMMISRTCLEKMFLSFPDTKYTDDIGYLQDHENKYAYALFNCSVLETHYLSEDWLFCERWHDLDGEVWIDVTIKLGHIGSHLYQGYYLASIV
jgi:Anp1